jgi:RNA recognition motif-containing protein
MAKKLFVGGLSWDTTDDGLRQAFASNGEITEAKVITDRNTGRSRGFGFVTFAQDEDAKTAISKMDGTTLDGKAIKVNEAQEKSPRGGGGRSGGGFGGGRGGGRNRW